MSKRIIIQPRIYIDADTDNVADGHQTAQDIWCSTSAQSESKTTEQAATDFVEAIIELTMTCAPEVVAAHLYGAACFFLEVAGKPTMTEVKA